MEKILRTLIEKFNYVIVSMEESKYIDALTIEELQSLLGVSGGRRILVKQGSNLLRQNHVIWSIRKKKQYVYI